MTVNAEVAEVLRRVRRRVVLHVEVVDNAERAAAVLREHESVDTVRLNQHRMEVTLCEGVTDFTELPTRLVREGFKLRLFSEEQVNLESAFMALTKGMGAKI